MLAAQVDRVPPTGFAAAALTTFWARAADEAALAADRLRRARCGLGGHAMMLHFEPNRISLECMSCGHQTPGWSIQATRT